MKADNSKTAAAKDTLVQFLTFTLGSEEYGVDILRVQEIKCYSTITPIPNAPPHVKGVMNLRGTVVPVIDLRVRFGFKDVPYTSFTVIVLITIGTRVVGMIVDAVSDVLQVSESQLAPPPDLGLGIDTSFLKGIARVEDRLVALVNIDKVGTIGAIEQNSGRELEVPSAEAMSA